MPNINSTPPKPAKNNKNFDFDKKIKTIKSEIKKVIDFDHIIINKISGNTLLSPTTLKKIMDSKKCFHYTYNWPTAKQICSNKKDNICLSGKLIIGKFSFPIKSVNWSKNEENIAQAVFDSGKLIDDWDFQDWKKFGEVLKHNTKHSTI